MNSDINTNVRLFDLVRYMRSELHEADLITDEEYGWLCHGCEMAKGNGNPAPRTTPDSIDTWKLRTTTKRLSDGIRRQQNPTEGNDFMIPENTDTPLKADCPSAPCSASFDIFELREFAFRALPKKELVRLLTLVGEPPQKSVDRQRNLMALRLARYADSVKISVQWDERMPNV